MTIADLQALPLGYLTGTDLLQYCPAPLLLSMYNQDNLALQTGCNQACAEATGKLLTRYDCTDEIRTRRGDAREQNLAAIISILALRKILGSAASQSDVLTSHFRWADTCLRDIRNGQMNLLLPQPPAAAQVSSARLTRQRFGTLG